MGLSYKQGKGAGSLTYTLGENPSRSAAVQATTTSYYNNGTLYSVILNLYFQDSSEGQVFLMLIVNPFTGTGSYDSKHQYLNLLFTTEKAGNGHWSDPADSDAKVTLDVIYGEAGGVARWQGTMVAENLVWEGPKSRPAVSLHVSALTLTITESSS